MIISKKHNLYLLAALVYCANVFAVKINGEELSNIINPGKILVCTINDDLARISIKDGNIEVESRILTSIGNINEKFNNLKEQKGGVRFTSKDISISGKDINNSCYFATAHERIFLEAGNKLSLTSSILTSPKVVFSCNKFDLTNCYVDTDILQFQAISPESLCQIIRCKFNKNYKYPYIVEGQIDFANNQTIEDLYIFGVEEIEMSFSPKAFELTN